MRKIDLRQRAGGRFALLAIWAGALLVSACASSSATVPSANTQPQQEEATRQAYTRMLLQDTHKDDGTDKSKAGGSDNSNSNAGGQSTGLNAGRCSAVTLAATPSSPQVAGVTATFSGAAAGCKDPQYEFWMRPPGGQWSLLRAFSSSSTASWGSAGLAAGNYEFDVWAKAHSTDVVISPIATYVLQAPAPAPPAVCTSVTWDAPTPADPEPPGMKVALSGTAAGCASPLYQFWIQPPGGQWAILQAYSSSAGALWDTTGLATGTYSFDVWVKRSGSTNDWEAHISPNPTYTLQAAAPCSSVTWNTPSPAEPQAPGAQVTLGGVASGCPNPQYQFWIFPPGGPWSILQPYSSSSTVTWSTGGAPTGTYLFDIWVRQLGSSAGWEAHISPNPTYTLQTGPPCTSSTLTFSPASPSAAASTSSIQLTAVSGGCPNPTYEFWVEAPGGAWTILQSYSSSATATWLTTGLAPGTYLFDVWVKQAGNSPDWEAHISPNPTYTMS